MVIGLSGVQFGMQSYKGISVSMVNETEAVVGWFKLIFGCDWSI